MSETVIESREAIVAYIERTTSIATGDIESVTRSLQAALEQGHRRFGEEHAAYIEEVDGAIVPVFGRTAPDPDIMRSRYILVGVVDGKPQPDARNEWDSHVPVIDVPESFLAGEKLSETERLRLASPADVQRQQDLRIWLKESDWQRLDFSMDIAAQNRRRESKFHPQTRGRVFTTERHQHTQHDIYLGHGDEVLVAIPRHLAEHAQSSADQTVASTIDRLEWTGDEPAAVRHAPADATTDRREVLDDVVYYPYHISKVKQAAVRLTPNNSDASGIEMSGLEIVNGLLDGTFLPPLRHHQTTRTMGEELVWRHEEW